MMSHFLFIENEDLVCKYGFHMLSRWKLLTQDRPLWLDQLCGTGRVSGVRVVRVCNIQKRKGLVYQCTRCTMSHFNTFHISHILCSFEIQWTWYIQYIQLPCSLVDPLLQPQWHGSQLVSGIFFASEMRFDILRLLSRSMISEITFEISWDLKLRYPGYWMILVWRYDISFLSVWKLPILQSSHEVSMAQAPSAVASTASRKSYMMPSTLPEDSLDSSISRN